MGPANQSKCDFGRTTWTHFGLAISGFLLSGPDCWRICTCPRLQFWPPWYFISIWNTLPVVVIGALIDYSLVEMWGKLYSFLADAFDTEQLLECMGQLKRAQPVNVPIYDFKKHRRCSESFRKVPVTLKPANVIKLPFLCEFEFMLLAFWITLENFCSF